MKSIQKMVLPAVISLAGLTAFEANAAALTAAGTQIENTAVMNYSVNGSSKEVKALNDLLVDVKVDLEVIQANADGVHSTSEQVTIDTTVYYVVGKYDISNSSNANATIKFSAADAASFAHSGGAAAAPTLTGANYVYSLDGTSLLVADGDGEYSVAINQAADNASIPATTVYVLATSQEAIGKDGDIMAAELTASVKKVTNTLLNAIQSGGYAVGATDSRNDAFDKETIQFVFADNDGNNSESAIDGLKLDNMPDFGTNPDGTGTNSAFTKTSEVVWDPFTGKLDTANGKNPKAIPGSIVKYTVVLNNKGSGAANNVSVSDTLPAELTYCDTAPNEAVSDGITCALTATAPTDGPNTDVAPTASSSASAVSVVYSTFSGGNTSTITFYAIVN